jgi:hypothetical protein
MPTAFEQLTSRLVPASIQKPSLLKGFDLRAIWVFRSDADEAHRLSLSARFLTTMTSQVKGKHDARSPHGRGTFGTDRPVGPEQLMHCRRITLHPFQATQIGRKRALNITRMKFMDPRPKT